MKSLSCIIGIHSWEPSEEPYSGDPIRGCPKCDKIQIFSISMGLNFWHDFAKGWTYSTWKKYSKAKTLKERMEALKR